MLTLGITALIGDGAITILGLTHGIMTLGIVLGAGVHTGVASAGDTAGAGGPGVGAGLIGADIIAGTGVAADMSYTIMADISIANQLTTE